MHNYTFLLSQGIYPIGFTIVTWFLSLIIYRDRICCLAGSKCCRRKNTYTKVDEEMNDIQVNVTRGPPNLHDFENEEDSAQELSPPYDDKNEKFKENRNPPVFSIRQHWFIIVSFTLFDTITSTLAILPILYLPSFVLLIFGQLTLPLNLLFSKVILKYEYAKSNYYGAFIVLLGVFVASYTQFGSTTLSSDAIKATLFWCGLLLLVKLIDAGGTIYREKMLKSYNLKPWHVTVWVSLFQSILSLALIPIILIPFPRPWEPLTTQDLAPYIRNSFHCLFNEPLELDTSLVIITPSPMQGVNNTTIINPEDLCVDDNNFMLFLAFLFFNIVVNVMSLTLIKLKSSNYAIVMSAFRIGLVSILLSIPAIAGVAYSPISFLQVIGTFVILLGMLVYDLYTPQAPLLTPQTISVDSLYRESLKDEKPIILDDEEEENM
jgi:hypothetical protein